MKTFQIIGAALLMMSLLMMSATPAMAQINPFRSNKTGPTLSTTDMDLLGASIAKLNGAKDVAVGSKESWSNPATASYGTSEVTRIFRNGKVSCHRVHHEVGAQGRTPPRPYDLTWCRTPAGSWKLKS